MTDKYKSSDNINNAAPEEFVELGRNWKLRFWTVFAGQGFSIIGSSLTQFVLLWWITDKTASVSVLAFAAMAALLPQALLSPLGGTLADRYSRRKLMILSDAVSAICMVLLIILFLTENIQIWHAYVMMAVRGAMQAVQAPASAASIAMLVPKSYLSRASGINQTLQAVTTIASAPLGALAISVMPVGWALSIDVITALLAILPLLLFTIPQFSGDKEKKSTMLIEFTQGLKLVTGNKGLRKLYILMAGIVLIIMPSFTFLPLLIKTHFNGGAGHVALMEGLSGVGMAAGGIIVTVIAPKKQVLWVLAGFLISALTMSFTALTPADNFALAVFFWALSGFSFVLGNAPLTALLQEIIPNKFQGRALSLLNTMMGLAAPAGLAAATPLGELIGLRWMFVLSGILGAALCIVFFFSASIRSLSD